MTAGSMTPLSLAYLIEISFVINLAYHELNTFKLRDSIQEKTGVALDEFKNMWEGGNEDLFQPEWDHLDSLSKGNSKDAWEHKKRRFFYHHLIYPGWDRVLIRGLLCMDVFILIVCTLFADAVVGPIFDNVNPLTTVTTFWWIGFGLLVASIIIPALFMWLARCCKQYIFGCVEEVVSDGKEGRLKELGQAVLKKVRALVLAKH